MTKALNVWWGDTRVGVLTQTKDGALEFTYAAHWLADDRPSLSLSLSKRASPFKEKECRPFFAGLLPEEAQRRRIATTVGVSPANDFALLDALGEDVAGAIAFLTPDALPRSRTYDTQTLALTDTELRHVIEQLPKRPLLAGIDGLRLSLAGAQSKVPVVLVGENVALPLRGQPTTHILKPPIPDYPGTTENEALVMRLALAVGLDVAPVEPRIVDDRSFLLVTRYDRVADAEGRIQRLHQEDFCQALGILPQRKYAKEGGPAFKASFDLVRSASAFPAKDVLALLDAALFNLIVGNADAHGKNFSLLYKPGQTRLAPLYDLLSTVHYPDLSPNLAMKIGRAGRLAELDGENWRRFSTDAGVPIPAIRRRCHELCEAITQRLPSVRDDLSSNGFGEAHFEAIARTISNRAELAAVKLPEKKSKLANKDAGIQLVVGSDMDLNRRTAGRDGTTHTALVRIVNKTRSLLTGCYLNVGNIEPPVQATSTLCLIANLTLTAGLSKLVPVLTHAENSNSDHMLLQFQRVGGFLVPSGRGLLHSEHTFDLMFGSDQNITARLRCRARVDPRGQMHLDKVGSI